MQKNITPIQDVIPERRIVVFAPHFDDFLLMVGGYILELKKAGLINTKEISAMVLFSRSNYLARTGSGNFDTSLDRLKLATGKRLLEDMDCMDELLGEFNYDYRLVGEMECFAREKPFADSDMEFPHGVFEDFNKQDWQIFERMKNLIRKHARIKDTAIIFPLAVKEHIDHFIVREAGMAIANELGNTAEARFYFQEDKPYSGIAFDEELERAEVFVNKNGLESRVYHYDPVKVTELAFKHYVSQVEELYKTGIEHRSSYLKAFYGANAPCDQIFVYNPKTAGSNSTQ